MIFKTAQKIHSSAILQIYAQYIETNITFEYVLPSAEEFAARIEKISANYPYIICEEEGQIIAYAYAARKGERAAYQWDVELSVYVDKNFLHQGIGKRLYTALLAVLKEQNICNAYACITLPNEASCRLQEAFDFIPAGVHYKTGYKNGAWHDCIWYQKSLSDKSLPPEPFIPFRNLAEEKIKQILASCAVMKI